MMKSEQEFNRYNAMLHEAVSSDQAIDWITDLDAAIEMIANNPIAFAG